MNVRILGFASALTKKCPLRSFKKGIAEISDKLSDISSKLRGAGTALTAGITAPLTRRGWCIAQRKQPSTVLNS